jgi:hypothetical protein
MSSSAINLSGSSVSTVRYRSKEIEELSRLISSSRRINPRSIPNSNTRVSTLLSRLPPSPLRISPHFNLLHTCVFLLGTTGCSVKSMQSDQSSRVKRTKRTPTPKSPCVKYANGSPVHTDISRASSSGRSTPLSHPHSRSSRPQSLTLHPSSPSTSNLASTSQPVARPQPRIQVSSLLAETNNRYDELNI